MLTPGARAPVICTGNQPHNRRVCPGATKAERPVEWAPRPFRASGLCPIRLTKKPATGAGFSMKAFESLHALQIALRQLRC